MANFNVRIAERQFSRRGVIVDFNENLYGDLLDELAPSVPEQKIPLVNVTPARLWGASFIYKMASPAAHRDGDLPSGAYNHNTATVEVNASEKPNETNKALLYATRAWSADISGELAEARQRLQTRRPYLNAALVGTIGVGAVVGGLLGSVEGAVPGAVIGIIPGGVAVMIDAHRDPYSRRWSQFSEDPDVIAQFGRVITYKQA